MSDDKCTCHERDSSFRCAVCQADGEFGHMEENAEKNCRTCKNLQEIKFIVDGSNSRTTSFKCKLADENIAHPDMVTCIRWEEKLD